MHRREDRTEFLEEMVRFNDALSTGRIRGRLHVRWRQHALNVRREGKILFQPKLIARGVAIPARKIPARFPEIAGAGHLEEVRRIEVARPEVVISSVPAGDRQAADHIEVIAVGKCREAVLTLCQRQEVRPYPAHSQLRFFPGSVHEAKLPAGPMIPPGHVLGILGIDFAIVDRWLAEGGRIRACLRGDRVRRGFARRGIVAPRQTGLVVEMDAQHVRPLTISHGALHDPGRTAASDVRVGPVAFHAEVHLVPAAHRADAKEIDAAADQVGFGIPRMIAVERIETEAVFSFDEPLGPFARPQFTRRKSLRRTWLKTSNAPPALAPSAKIST